MWSREKEKKVQERDGKELKYENEFEKLNWKKRERKKNVLQNLLLFIVGGGALSHDDCVRVKFSKSVSFDRKYIYFLIQFIRTTRVIVIIQKCALTLVCNDYLNEWR